MTKISLPTESVDLMLGDNNIKNDDRFFEDYFKNKEEKEDIFSEDEFDLDPYDPFCDQDDEDIAGQEEEEEEEEEEESFFVDDALEDEDLLF